MTLATLTTRLFGALALTAALGSAGLAAGHGKSTKTIVETAVATDSLSTLVAAVKAADLVETLSGPGPFTVFAPTNDAFAALPAGTVETLLKPENKDQLTKILTCHVISGEVMASAAKRLINDSAGALPLETVGGCVFTAMTNGRQIMIRDGEGRVATVALADVMTSNGVVHVIDSVLLPAPEQTH